MGELIRDPDEHAQKHGRVAALLDRAGVDAVLLESPAAVNWYLDGARTHVSLAADPVVAVRVDRAGARVLTPGSEAARLLAEELPPGVPVVELPWWMPPVAAAEGAVREDALAAELRAARAELLPGELRRFRELGRDCARMLTDVLSAVTTGSTERGTAAAVAGASIALGIDPLVVLVAGSARLGHRHPLPTGGVLGDRAIVVVCGRRHGQIANLSRWVRRDPENAAERDRTRRIRAVEAAYWAALRPGRTLAEVFEDGTAAYVREGFDADEWRRHHQGGAAGYHGRDPRAHPGALDVVTAPQAFAWNPSAPGAKVEDTVVFDGRGVEVLTSDPRWPSSDHDGMPRPDELVLD